MGRFSRLMYNEIQKRMYIDSEPTMAQSLERYFKRVAEKENEFGKDITEMNITELKITISSLGIRRERNVGHLISLLRGYVSWARFNGITDNDAMFSVTPEAMSYDNNVREQMLRDPQHLQRILHRSLDDVNYQNRSARDSLIFWLLYAGLHLDEISELKKSDLNTEQNCVVVGDVNFSIGDDVVELWDTVAKADRLERRYANSSRSSDKANEFKDVPLLNGDYLFRQDDTKKAKSAKCPEVKFANIVKKVCDAYSENGATTRLTPTTLQASGAFYRLFTYEQSGNNLTKEMVLKEVRVPYSDGADMAVKARKYLIDYEDWKLAFKL